VNPSVIESSPRGTAELDFEPFRHPIVSTLEQAGADDRADSQLR
jgi:hypothetical protein